MNNNSIICRYISEHTDWRNRLSTLKIMIKESGALAILNYDMECDFTNPVVQEARGIIINTETLDVVCWPFRKFANYGESYADSIDWNTARVQDKIDGSIVKLWYNRAADKWQWSTNSMIDAADTHIMDSDVSFMSLIRRADNYKDIHCDELDRDKTYIFELVAPEQKVVIRYDYPFLYHIGTRSNITGQEYNDSIGINKPREYPLHSISECIKAAKALNLNCEVIKYEGYVVVDADWHRIKVKSPEYIYAHRIASVHVYTKKRILPMVMTNDVTIEEMIKTAPDSEVYVRFYQWRYAELKKSISTAIAKARALYEELEHDRKAIADYLKNEPLKTFCFKSLGNNKTAVEIISELQESVIMKLVDDYSLDDSG